jgi:hypothetical protein
MIAMTHPATTYPVRVDGTLDPRLSRWLWLVKWLLAFPHYVVLAFLWIAFGVLSIGAFFAILFTGRYPRPIFDFNVGVLRWSWRVAYYAYGALGTDRYPPFTLDDVPGYPAHLDVAYPEHLSRGLVFVKWLLAIPHFIIVGLFVGAWSWVLYDSDRTDPVLVGGGLIGLLVLIAAVVLLFTGSYPRGLFDFILGMNRWALRVAGYAALMTDAYPPLRLDGGGPDPSSVQLSQPPSGPAPGSRAETPRAEASPGSPPSAPAPGPASAAPPPAAQRPGRWTAGRIVAVVIGAVLLLAGAGLASGAAVVGWADQTQRDSAGFLSTSAERFASPGHALTSRTLHLEAEGPDWLTSPERLGEVRLGGTAEHSDDSLFIGVGAERDVDGYLAGVERDEVVDVDNDFDNPEYLRHAGGAPATAPGEQDFWVESSEGIGTQSVVWTPEEGEWTAVVMNADGTSPVEADLRFGAEVPWLTGIAVGLAAGAAMCLVLGSVLVLVGVLRRT